MTLSSHFLSSMFMSFIISTRSGSGLFAISTALYFFFLLLLLCPHKPTTNPTSIRTQQMESQMWKDPNAKKTYGNNHHDGAVVSVGMIRQILPQNGASAQPVFFLVHQRDFFSPGKVILPTWSPFQFYTGGRAVKWPLPIFISGILVPSESITTCACMHL